jgi:hypothetical protein
MPNQSPSYPSVSLPVALERVKSLHDDFGQVEVSLSDALNCWGYKPRGGTGYRLVSAMVSFGLLDSSGVGNERRLRISRVLLDHFFSKEVSEYDKSEAIQDFAIKPGIYQMLWKFWGYGLPADDDLKQYLVDELGFNPRMVPQFLRGYRETLEFAKEHGLAKTCDDIDFDDTNLEFDEDELKFSFGRSHQDLFFSEDDTDLEIEIASQSYRSTPGNLALKIEEEDTYLEATTIDVPLEPISSASENYLDDDDIDFTLNGDDNGDVVYSNNIDNIGNLLRSRVEKRKKTDIREIARYMVANNCNIYLSADGLVDRQAIEALIAQLKLQLELGEFGSEDD